MSLAKKCDLCGVLYEYYSGRNGMSLERIHEKGSVNGTEKTFDLCPSCMDALVRFMEGRIDKNGRHI